MCGMPRALLLYQDADAILQATARRELLDELATGIATDRLRALKLDYRNHRVVAGGRVPHSGGGNASDMFSLLASYSILNAARSFGHRESGRERWLRMILVSTTASAS